MGNFGNSLLKKSKSIFVSAWQRFNQGKQQQQLYRRSADFVVVDKVANSAHNVSLVKTGCDADLSFVIVSSKQDVAV